MTPLSEDRNYWDKHARHDPLWAVLSETSKAGRQWRLADFMKTGEREIALLCLRLEQLGVPVPSGAALDFGCGVGRLTQALARRCTSVIGIDISARMIGIATRLNRYDRIATYIHNEHERLPTIPTGSLDFIYSNITLQHMAPSLAVGYLREFFRVLRPGGLLVFQLPSHLVNPSEATTRPMAADAYRTAITLLHEPPNTMSIGAAARLSLNIANLSSHTWRQPDVGSLRVGNHWLDVTGDRMVIQDDARAVLPQIFSPEQQYVTELTITAPREAGAYTAEIDLVHEGIRWFDDRGSKPLRFQVNVAASTVTDPAPPRMLHEHPIPAYDESILTAMLADAGAPASAGAFPMHGVPREDVVALMTELGGTVVHVEDDPRAGSEWQSYRYVVRG